MLHFCWQTPPTSPKTKFWFCFDIRQPWMPKCMVMHVNQINHQLKRDFWRVLNDCFDIKDSKLGKQIWTLLCLSLREICLRQCCRKDMKRVILCWQHKFLGYWWKNIYVFDQRFLYIRCDKIFILNLYIGVINNYEDQLKKLYKFQAFVGF